jgi:hypothetical protein
MSVAFFVFAGCLWMLVAVTASHEDSCPADPPAGGRPGRGPLVSWLSSPSALPAVAVAVRPRPVARRRR